MLICCPQSSKNELNSDEFNFKFAPNKLHIFVFADNPSNVMHDNVMPISNKAFNTDM